MNLRATLLHRPNRPKSTTGPPTSRTLPPTWVTTALPAHLRRLGATRFGALLRVWAGGVAQALVLLAVAFALLWPAPFDRSQLPGTEPGSDLFMSHWPSATVLKDSFQATGRLPLWNPYYGGGRSVLADPLAAAAYPPTFLVLVLPLRDAFLALQLGHLLWAGFGMLLLARRAARLPIAPALVAAVAFMGSPRLIGHLGAGHLTMVQAAAWLPWIALCCWGTIQRPRRWAIGLGLSVALLFLAGHPQLAYYGGLLVVGLSAWLLVARWRQAGLRAALAALAGLVAAGLLAGLLAAVHLLPLREFSANSTRQHTINSTDAWTPRDFLLAVVGNPRPSAVPQEDIFEPGSLVIALAAFGLLARPRAAIPLALGLAIVAGLTLGHHSPVYDLAARVLPEFDHFRGLGRIWFLSAVPLALLAGYGADAVARGWQRTFPRSALAVGPLCVLLLAVTLIPRAALHSNVNPLAPFLAESALAQEVTTAAGGARIYGVQRNVAQLDAARLGAELADGQDPLLIEPYVSFMQRAGGYEFSGYQLSVPPFEVFDPGYPTSREAQPDAELLGLFNVGIVISRTPLTDPRLLELGQLDGSFYYRNQANAGRAYLVAPGVGNRPPGVATIRQLTGGVREDRRWTDGYALTVTTDNPAYLVVASPAYPGWIATLDGQSAQVETIDGALPAIAVPPGTHQITYTYNPGSVRLGGALTVAGLAICTAALLITIVGRMRSLARRRSRVRQLAGAISQR